MAGELLLGAVNYAAHVTQIDLNVSNDIDMPIIGQTVKIADPDGPALDALNTAETAMRGSSTAPYPAAGILGTSVAGDGVYGQTDANGAQDGYSGIKGTATGTDGHGVLGIAHNGENAAVGVRGASYVNVSPGWTARWTTSVPSIAAGIRSPASESLLAPAAGKSRGHLRRSGRRSARQSSR
jgi:hypothetical protein